MPLSIDEMLFCLIMFSVLAVLTLSLLMARKRLPKGPLTLPIIGNLHQLIYYSWKTGGTVEGLHEFKKQFGNVFTIWMGPNPTVHIADFDIAHETHVRRANTFGMRNSTGPIDYVREGRGLLTSNGEFWQSHKRFALTTLKNFGVGRNLMEERIMDEYTFRFEDYKKSNFKNGGIEVDASSCFNLLVGSIINMLLFSERYQQRDDEFETLRSNLAKTLDNSSIIDALTPLWLLRSRFWKWRAKTVLAPFDVIHESIDRKVQKRVAAIESGEHIISEQGDDFVDAFLIKMGKDEKEGVESTFNLDTLTIDLYDLWIGGQETTSTTLTWACACLLNHPEVVEELRRELVQVTGGNRSLSLTDRTKTPYLNATINEIQRIASILSSNLFRELREDTVIDGQPISAGTAVTVQLSMLHTDDTVFKNPEEFRPERFVENNNLEKTLIPFGIGKRACPGESLARAELYLILGNLVLDYTLEPIGAAPEIKTPTPFGIMKRGPNFDIRLVPVN